VPAPRLSVSILGPWELRVDGRLLPRPSTQKAQSLLAYLIVHRSTAHSREKLAALFWPDADEDRAQRSLRTALWSLRRLLSDTDPETAEALDTSRFDVRWAPHSEVAVDLEQFEQAARQWAQVRDEPQAAIPILQPAVALYRGPFLEGLYDDWCLDERYRLEEQYLSMLQALVIGLEAVGQYREAVSCAQQLLVVDPLREEVHRTIIRLLGKLGDRAGVTRQYQRCKEVLARELDVAPSPETEATLAEALQTVHRQLELSREVPHQAASVPAATIPAPAQSSPAAADRAYPVQPAREPSAVAHRPGQQEPRLAEPESSSGLPLVGRDTQWQTLITWLGQTESGHGRTALIAGEAGSGKTRLLEEVAARARWRSMRVLWGSCYEYERMLPYQPFIEALRNGLRLTGAASTASGLQQETIASSDLATLAALPPVWQQALLLLLPDWTDRLPSPTQVMAEPNLDQPRLLEGIGQLLQALAGRQPLLLVIDDLHWAAPSTLQIFHYIARMAQRHRILLLGSYRPEDIVAPLGHEPEAGAASTLSLAGLQRHLQREGLLETLTLERLQHEDVVTLVQRAPSLSQDREPAETISTQSTEMLALAERLYQFTEGNPLYLVAAMQTLREGGDLTAEPAAQRSGAWTVPVRIRDLLQDRLDHLSAPAREATRIAAVAGREFDFALLQQAWSKSEEETLQAFDDLLGHGVVKEVTTRGARDFAFTHHLLQEIIYDGLTRPLRIRIHRRVATAMEALYNPRLVAAELAFHYERSGVPVQAIFHARVAGDQAATSYANQDAERYYTQALALLEQERESIEIAPTYRQQRFDLLAARLLVRQRIGKPEDEARDVESMLALARDLRDPRREAQSLLERSDLHMRTGRYAEAETSAREALVCARQESTGDDTGSTASMLAARASTYLGLTCFLQDRYDEAQQAYEDALAGYRMRAATSAGTREDLHRRARSGEAEVLNDLGRLYQRRGDYGAARQQHMAALAMYQADGDLRGEASVLSSLGSICWYAGDLNEAQRYWEKALSLEQRMGYRHGEGIHLRNLGLVLWRLGNLEPALLRMQEARTIFEDLQDPERILECYHGIGDVRYVTGPLEEALISYERALDLARSLASSNRIAQSLFGCARATRALDRPAAAAALIVEARTICEAVGWPRGIAWCDREAGSAALDLGDAATARDLLRAATDGFLALGEPDFAAATQAELALAHLALQEYATARSLAEQAAATAHGRHGVDQPQAILFTLFRILSACNEAMGAQEALAAAHAEVEAQAGRILDPALRASFLHEVPVNREIMQAFAASEALDRGRP
jgi:DNA-binding SARP family transcriptional activator/predicted ATPase